MLKMTEKDIKVMRLGILSFLLGLILRFSARNLTWPIEYSYSGPRENTLWAIKEAALSEVSTVVYIFGLLIILLIIAKYIFKDEMTSNEE